MPVINTDTAEGKAELQKLIDAETEGLKTKNAELLGKVKKHGDDLKTVQDQLTELKEAKEKADQDALEKTGDAEKIKKSLEDKYKKQLEDKDAALSSKSSQLDKILIQNGLTEALVAAKVAPQHMKAVHALINASAKSEVVVEDGNAVAKFDGKPIADYVKTWSQSDEGKTYIAADNNSGGGAKGANGGGKAFTGNADMGGDRAERTAAIAAKYPELNQE